jgi:DNA invertase Pin-like site-specific DNA recombinase
MAQLELKGKARAAAYVRVSTAEQAQEGLSLPEQRRRLEAYIADQGWELAGIYEDAGISGKREDRPALLQVMRDLATLDKLVIVKLDRFGRSARHTLELFEQLVTAKVELVSLNDGFDTGTATGRMVPKLLAVLAEWESDNLGERVRGVMEARVREGGRRPGGPRPYGYEYRDKVLCPLPREAEIVRRIFSEFLAGRSQRAITRGLASDGVPAQRGEWHQGTISQIIRNPIHKGCVRLRGKEYPGQHEAIVAPELWGKAARLCEATARSKGGGRGRPSKGNHLFVRGHLRCGECGGAMIPRTDPNRASEPSETYRCYTRVRDPELCSQAPVKREEIDAAVYAYFEKVGLDVEATRAQLSEAVDRRLAEVRALRDEAEAEERRAVEAFSRIRRDYKKGQLSASEWQEFRSELTEERDAAAAEAARLREQEREIAERGALRDCEEETLRALAEIRQAIVGEVKQAGDLEAVRAALQRLFAGFVLHRTDSEAAPTRQYLDLAFLGRGAEYVIEPLVQDQVIEGYTEKMTPILRREPLYKAENNDVVGLTT